MTSYATFVKHAEKVTKSASTSRPILKGVHHAENANIYVTDSHRLYILENGFKTDTPFTNNPKTGELIEGNYPDCSRLLPYDDDAVETLNIDVKQALEAVKVLATAEKKINDGGKYALVKFSVGTDSYIIQNGTTDGLFNGSYKLSEYEGDGILDIYVNAQYLSEALALLVDSGEPNATLRLYTTNRPLTIKNSDTTVLILPVRKY